MIQVGTFSPLVNHIKEIGSYGHAFPEKQTLNWCELLVSEARRSCEILQQLAILEEIERPNTK
jgi:hypothetical protein